MGTRIKGRISLLLFAFAVVMLVFPAMALAQEETTDPTASPSPAPTIQSDQEDYPPVGTVILTGSNWQPGETVNINVNDDEGQTWNRNVDVVADENGNVRDEFQLPAWFVATYSVKATGSSGAVATTTFMDASLPSRGCDLPTSAGGPIVVDTPGDDFDNNANANGSCSLREAIAAANADNTVTADTITLPLGLYTLARTQGGSGSRPGQGDDNNSRGDLDIIQPLTINGANARTTTIHGGGIDRVLHVRSDGSLTLNNATVTGGLITNAAGGGIRSDGKPMTFTDVTIANNSVVISGGGDDGGGIYNAGGNLTINRATISGNSAGTNASADGGGLYSTGGTGDLRNVTITNNTATGSGSSNGGGGFRMDGGTTTFTNVTVSYNGASTGSNILRTGGTLNLRNTIISNGIGSADCALPSGSTTNNGNNLDSGISCGLGTSNGNLQNANANLGTLQNNGGPTDTRALGAGSAAIDTGTATGAPGVDQRNEPRPKDGDGIDTDGVVANGNAEHDIGAYELQAPHNAAPVAQNGSAITNEDTSTLITLSATDADGNSLTYKITSLPANGKLFKGNSTEDEITSVPFSLGSGVDKVTYVPNLNYNNTGGATADTFKFKANDGTVDSNNEATVSVTVNAVNDKPVIDLNGGEAGTGHSATFTEDGGPKAIVDSDALTVTDVDNANLASATVKITNLLDGTAESLNADVGSTGIAKNYTPSTGELTLTGPATKAQFEQVLRTVTYNNTSQNPNTTARSVSFVVNDGAAANANSDAATSTVTINVVNDAPDAVNDSDTTDEDTPLEILAADLLANDTDGDGDTLSISDFDENSAEGGTVSRDNGTFTYTPAENFFGTDSFDYTVDDGSGATNSSDTATVTITVNPVNDPPDAVNDDRTGTEDTDLTIDPADLFANDTDPDAGDTLSLVDVSNPMGGSVSVNDDGEIVFKPTANLCGPDAATFDYTVEDAAGESDTATVTIDLTCVDDLPVASDDAATVLEDAGATAIDVLANDDDIDDGPKTIESVTQPTKGAVVITGGGSGLTYKPNLNECNNGTPTDDFTYTLNGSPGSTATVAMTVTCVNDLPDVSNNKGTQNVQYSDPTAPVTISATDSDTAGSSLTASTQFKKDSGTFGNGLPQGLSLAIASTSANDRTWTLSGNANVAPGTYVVRVTVSDGAVSASTDITIVVAKEDATAGFNGPLFYAVPSGSANVTLSAVITDAADGNRGDIRNATVTFVNRDAAGQPAFTGCTNRPVALLTSGDTTVGVATCTVPLPFSSSGSTQYTVGIKVNNYYTRDNSADNAVVTVSQAVNGMITGGGYLVNQNSFGQYAGGVGQKTNFGFNVKYNKSLTSLQGNINTIIRSSDGKVYQIKGNSMTSLTTNLSVATAKKATFLGKANLTDITNPLAPVSLGGNHSLKVTMTDAGEPGKNDTIGIQLTRADGSLLFSSKWVSPNTVEQLLGGGNLVVR